MLSSKMEMNWKFMTLCIVNIIEKFTRLPVAPIHKLKYDTEYFFINSHLIFKKNIVISNRQNNKVKIRCQWNGSCICTYINIIDTFMLI